MDNNLVRETLSNVNQFPKYEAFVSAQFKYRLWSLYSTLLMFFHILQDARKPIVSLKYQDSCTIFGFVLECGLLFYSSINCLEIWLKKKKQQIIDYQFSQEPERFDFFLLFITFVFIMFNSLKMLMLYSWFDSEIPKINVVKTIMVGSIRSLILQGKISYSVSQ